VAEVDGTTSEIRWIFDAATTDGEYVTSGLGMVIDQWQFLAFFAAMESSGNLVTPRIWRGTVDEPPVMFTPSVSVSPAGNWVGQNTVYVGNHGTATTAFQGDIGSVSFLTVRSSGATQPFSVITNGTLDADIERNIEKWWVNPIWQGRSPQFFRPPAVATQWMMAHIALDGDIALASQVGETLSNYPTITTNGATASQRRPPRQLPRAWIHDPYVARAA
jgi:hypothetical protein